MSRILIVLSAASAWIRADGSEYDSGVWAEEFVVMHETFVRAGCDVDIATPGGVAPTIDPHSMSTDVVGHAQVKHFRRYLDSIAPLLAKPLALANVTARSYDVIAIPGGHGPVVDLYKDPEMGLVLLEA
jgi:putative intracellular protease/amidase